MEFSPPEAETCLRDPGQCVCEYFARCAESFGLPRSVGQIFSRLFLSPEPLSFGQIVASTAISKASASLGLRTLQKLHAIETVIVSGDRRTFYRAQTSARRLLDGLLTGTILSQLDAGDRLLQEAAVSASDNPHLSQRISSLQHWQNSARGILPLLQRLSLG